MALEGLVFAAILQADQEVGAYRLLHRHCRSADRGLFGLGAGGRVFERPVDLLNDGRQFGRGNGVVADVGRHDVGGDPGKRFQLQDLPLAIPDRAFSGRLCSQASQSSFAACIDLLLHRASHEMSIGHNIMH